ncbi:MAG: AsmA-like C-terminal region-containing protein [Desulfarculaceae bacterium]|nr:AsmA-like C-terminal region-containing protein [Desulfarculaceae bacterium]
MVVFKRFVKYLLLFLAALALAWLVVYLAGWSIPADFLRASLTRELNEDLAPLRLTLEGPIRLTPTLTPTVSMSQIKVVRPNPKLPVITLGCLSIKVSLVSLLGGDVNLENVTISDMRLPLAPEPGRKQEAALHFSHISGRLLISGQQASLENLVLRLDRSSLTGRATLDTKPDPPKLVIHLESPQADLDSLAHVVALEDEGTRPAPERRRALLDTLDNLVDRIIKTVQGELILKANHVIWKKKAAGRGELHITAKNRRLAIERLELGLPGGKISMRNAIWPDGGGLGSSLDLEIRNFSYGFLTREKPKGPMRSQGVLSMRLSLISQAPKASDLLGRADGVFQVGLWPKDLETASFDLWAANLLFALLDSLAAKTGSHVNCAVGNFVMEKGLMTSKELIIDTSKVRVSGEAKLNFAKRTITVKLQPRAKQPQFFNLETPIHISGTFEQASAGVSPGGLVRSVINFATSPVFAPLRRLFGDTLPEAGKDVCRSPQTWPPAVAKSPANE